MPAGNHGTWIHLNKYLVQEDEYSYQDSLQTQEAKLNRNSCLRHFLPSVPLPPFKVVGDDVAWLRLHKMSKHCIGIRYGYLL